MTALLLPALVRAKAKSQPINCPARLKQIGLAFLTWSLDNDSRLPMRVSVTNGGTMELVPSGGVYPHFQVMSNELSTPKVLLCPSDEKRDYATNFHQLTDTNLSYFVNMDVKIRDPNSLLSGDRNITNSPPAGGRLVPLTRSDSIAWTKELHRKKGHIAFADGRVGLFSNGGVDVAIKIGDGTTNRLAVP
jgi:prepilin-type processing-associated H-X9-DG protein